MVLFCVCKLWCRTSRTCQTGLRSRHFHFKLKIYDLLQTAPLRGANWNRECRLSPHGALRAYTVFPTAVHLRCTLLATSSCAKSSITDRTSPRCESSGVLLSPHGALRAYTVFLTAVHLRCTLMTISSFPLFYTTAMYLRCTFI